MEQSKIFFGSFAKPADNKYNEFIKENIGIKVIDSRFISYNKDVFDHVIFLRYDDMKKKDIDDPNKPVHTGLIANQDSVPLPISLHAGSEYNDNPLLIIDDVNYLIKLGDSKISNFDYLKNSLLIRFRDACPYSCSTADTYKNSACYGKYIPCVMNDCVYFKRALEYYKRNSEKRTKQNK